jgi:hypothetical protein
MKLRLGAIRSSGTLVAITLLAAACSGSSATGSSATGSPAASDTPEATITAEATATATPTPTLTEEPTATAATPSPAPTKGTPPPPATPTPTRPPVTPAPLPNLTSGAPVVTPASPTCAVPFNVDAVITNVGLGPSLGSARVAVTAVRSSDGWIGLKAFQDVPALAAGSSVHVNMDVTITQGGSFELAITADSNLWVPESNEGDNVASKKIAVECGPA